jgi:hypothetical protein
LFHKLLPIYSSFNSFKIPNNSISFDLFSYSYSLPFCFLYTFIFSIIIFFAQLGKFFHNSYYFYSFFFCDLSWVFKLTFFKLSIFLLFPLAFCKASYFSPLQFINGKSCGSES